MKQNNKVALITGINGMDGSHLADLLLSKGYEVHGTMRRHAHVTAAQRNIEHILDKITLHVADMTDQSSLQSLIRMVDPDEIYNLAAQSFVGSSWALPVQTYAVNTLGVVNLLEAARQFAKPSVRIYQASTSEMYGLQKDSLANESTRFYPRSPYGVSKLAAHWACVNYRESYDMHINCGILFNHESERRGEEFVTQKIALGVARIARGLADKIELGNLEAKRDWGYAPEYVEAMWLMLQQDTPDDFVIGTGIVRSVFDFLEAAVAQADLPGDALSYYKQNARFMRPAEVDFLRADASKAACILNWRPRTNFKQLVGIMVDDAFERVEDGM